MRFRALLSLTILSTGLCFADKPVTITILHTNDIHAHVEPVSISKKLYGGYARQATAIKRCRATDPNVVLLNAGDTFQGTMYFSVYEGLADAAYMNAVGFQAMTLGNHEFDRGPSVLGTFAKAVTFPIVSANIDVSEEPALKDVVKPYAVVGQGDAKIGVVGAITPSMPDISSPGPTVKLKDLASSIQTSVNDLLSQGIDRIVLLSHVGYDEDLDLVKRLKGIDVVVGGHSHTPLGTPDLPGWPKPAGPYPTKVKEADGKDVLVVQAWEWGKVLGHLKLSFNAKGEVDKVLDAKPIPIDESVPEDPQIASMVAAFQRPIAAAMNQVVGYAQADLPKEGAMSRVIADAMLEATAKQGAVAAFVNAGGVRGGLESGKITYGMASSIQPFRNTLVTLEVSGDELLQALEHGAGGAGLLLPSEGTSYRIDPSKSDGSKVADVVVGGKPLDRGHTYKITVLSFTAAGGDAHTALRDAKGARVDTGIVDIDALIDYLKVHNPLVPPSEERVMR